MFALRSVRVALATAALIGSSLLGVAGSAHAAGQSLTIPSLSPNGRVCLQPVPANFSIDVQGRAYNNLTNPAQGHFTLNRSTDGGVTYTQVYGLFTTSVHATFSTSAHNFPGPGLYKWCGRNSTPSTESMDLSIDAY